MIPRIPSPTLRQTLRRKLLRWYDRNARDLPWRRRSADPYAQWVAEIMLQQTQVQTVIPYYERFINRFPDVRALAAASNDELLHHWQGLGYYRRAANLHKAAKQLAAASCNMPDSADALRALPGVGRYTAGAIASIAFNERAPIVDGNVTRVFARLFNITQEVSTPDTVRHLWTLAECLLPTRRCGDFNQSLMELGALICTPTSPRCDDCPVKRDCQARARNTQSSLPIKRKPRAVPEIHHVVILARCNGTILVTKRPAEGLWPNLWEFPNTATCSFSGDPTGSATLVSTRNNLNKLIAAHALSPIAPAERIGTITHRLTHRLMQFDAYACRVEAKTPARWVRVTRLADLPMSTACRKLLALMKN